MRSIESMRTLTVGPIAAAAIAAAGRSIRFGSSGPCRSSSAHGGQVSALSRKARRLRWTEDRRRDRVDPGAGSRIVRGTELDRKPGSAAVACDKDEPIFARCRKIGGAAKHTASYVTFHARARWQTNGIVRNRTEVA